MDNQDDVLLNLGESFEYANQYLKREIGIIKLEAAEKASKSTSSIATLVVMGFLVAIVLIMLSISAGFWLGKIMGSFALGFLVITGVYIVLALIVYFFQKKLVTNPILTIMLKSFFD